MHSREWQNCGFSHFRLVEVCCNVHLITSYTAEAHEMLFYEVSAKRETNVEEAFTALAAGRVAFICCWSEYC